MKLYIEQIILTFDTKQFFVIILNEADIHSDYVFVIPYLLSVSRG